VKERVALQATRLGEGAKSSQVFDLTRTITRRHTGIESCYPGGVSSDAPTRLGPYEIAAKIAGGGMASVYLGRAALPGGSDRVAAIKAIRSEFSGTEQFVTMFMDEAKILSRLDHPNIARTLEYGVEGQQHFIAMELLLGRTLLDVWDACVARSLPLRLDLAAWICARVADALHYAHELCDEQGHWLQIVHRDVNPSNVFLTYGGEVKLFDFGLARARGNHTTGAGIVKGKVAYLAPEQLQELQVDRRCDVFALGTTLWELTTMKRLFKRDQDLATLIAIKDSRIPDPRLTQSGYPDELWRIVSRALAKDRDERYQRASDLARDLDAFAGQQADGAMRTLVGTLQDDLFEGDRERQMGWLKRTSALTPAPETETNPPPAPLPTAHVRSAEEMEASARLAQFLAVGKPPSRPPPRA
jgi:eukaryotic-like serine/threonine-protein kinase